MKTELKAIITELQSLKYQMKEGFGSDIEPQTVYLESIITAMSNIDSAPVSPSDEIIIELADRRTKSLNQAESEYSNIKGKHYRDNERYTWAVNTINKKISEDFRTLFTEERKQK